MTRHFNAPDYKPPRLGPATYWFEAFEVAPGMLIDGCAFVAPDAYGEWVLEELHIGDWRQVNGRKAWHKCQPIMIGPNDWLYTLAVRKFHKEYDREIFELMEG